MARVRMVTRTVTTTTALIMAVDVITAKVENLTVMVSGDDLEDTAILKTARKLYETDTYKLVSVVTKKTETKLYGMPEEDFLKYARELPPRATIDNE